MSRFVIIAVASLLSLNALAADIPGWFMSGGGRKAYEVVLDTKVKRSGKASALLKPIDKPESYGTLMQAFVPNDYLGKRVRLTAYIKTEGATGRVDFWARVQAASSPADGMGLGGGHYDLPERSDWTKYEMVFDVPEAGTSLQFGVGLDGPGKVWIDDVKLEEVPKNTPIVNGRRNAPENLDFEG